MGSPAVFWLNRLGLLEQRGRPSILTPRFAIKGRSASGRRVLGYLRPACWQFWCHCACTSWKSRSEAVEYLQRTIFATVTETSQSSHQYQNLVRLDAANLLTQLWEFSHAVMVYYFTSNVYLQPHLSMWEKIK